MKGGKGYREGKLRTPQNKRFNDLINARSALLILSILYFFLLIKKKSFFEGEIPESLLDTSDLRNNSWFTGFT